jgi:type VI secretion system secreted protein Hcp
MKARVLGFLSVLCLGAFPLFAAYDAFIKFDGIQGESTKPGRTGWIEILDVSQGVTQTGAHAAGSGGGAGKVAVHDISITKKVDKSSAALMQAAGSGRHFQNVTIDAGPVHYALQDVMITGVQSLGMMGDGSMREVIKLTYLRDTMHADPAVTPNPVGSVAPVQATLLPAVQQPNATFSGGVNGGAMLRSLKPNGQTQAIIVVCDVAGGGTLTQFQRASLSRAPMAILSVREAANHATFTNAVVSGYSPSSGGCAQVSLNFTKYGGPAGGF